MKIIETTSQIEQMILDALIEQVYEELRKKALIIKQKLREVNVKIWQDSGTYWSLLHGTLNHEFGFVKGTAEQKVNAVLQAMSKSLKVYLRPFKKQGNYYVGFKIEVLSKSIPDSIFHMDEAEVQTGGEVKSNFSNDFASFSGGSNIDGTNNENTGRTLPWLSWLLTRGNELIVYGYEYQPIIAERSRSGKGLMVAIEGEAWKVPSEFSGTRNSHWLIRALKDERKYLLSEYGKVINEVLES